MGHPPIKPPSSRRHNPYYNNHTLPPPQNMPKSPAPRAYCKAWASPLRPGPDGSRPARRPVDGQPRGSHPGGNGAACPLLDARVAPHLRRRTASRACRNRAGTRPAPSIDHRVRREQPCPQRTVQRPRPCCGGVQPAQRLRMGPVQRIRGVRLAPRRRSLVRTFF